MKLDFRRPARELFPAFERFRDAFLADEHDMWPATTPFGVARTDLPAYLALLESYAPGQTPPPGKVPMETFWVLAGDEMAGELHVRHQVRGFLWRLGGHVGYSVQPKFRRQGIAMAMLRFACERLRELGEADLLITCWDDNVASAGVIEKCGGARIPDAIIGGRNARRYLIPLV